MPDAARQPAEVGESVILLTDDGRGVARALAAMLRAHGQPATLLRMPSGAAGRADDDTGMLDVDLADADAIEAVLERIERQARIAGLIHLLPLAAGEQFETLDLPGFRRRLERDVKSLFLLTRALGPSLRRSAASKGALLFGVTALGGAFGHGDSAPTAPSHGGVLGLVKTLAHEWPDVRCATVDLDPTEQPEALAGNVLREVLQPGAEIEIGYLAGRRTTLRARLSPAHPASPAMTIDERWVILITGGARGITAEIARDLAERYRPTLVLVGRSPLPDGEEPGWAAGLSSPSDLKAALIGRMRAAGETPRVEQVESAYMRLQRDREIRRTLAALQQAGSQVEYRPLDVRDAAAVTSLVQEIYARYGRLDGLIHGAGVIEDALLETKGSDSFDRVFNTKVLGAFTLARAVHHESLAFLAFFSSVAARSGSRGQADYAAANEVLNKLALALDRDWAARVVSINWAPWTGSGMATLEVQRAFQERGIQVITAAEGRRAFDRELRYGRKGQVEVVIGAGPWAAQTPPTSRRLPLLEGADFRVADDGAVEALVRLSESRDLYLRDHRLDGAAVLPATAALTLMAEVAQHGSPSLVVREVRDFHLLKGVTLEDGSRWIRVSARPRRSASNGMEVEVAIATPESNGPIFYRAVVALDRGFEEAPLYQAASHPGARPFPLTAEQAYRQWLFHGPRFHCITAIERMDDSGLLATVAPSFPRDALAGDPPGEWLVDPIALDAGPQLAILWSRATRDTTALPNGVRRFRRWGPPTGSPLRCRFDILPGSDDDLLRADVSFVGADGRLVAHFEGLEATCSRALNRLSGESVAMEAAR